MESKSYTTIDRVEKKWPSGPWDTEPDKVQWQDEATGLPCLAVRHGDFGHWCGYVGVAEGHPYFQQYYGSESDEEGNITRDYIDVDVHGGLTFSDFCTPGPEERAICHVPGEGEPDHVWWFGFDCAHHNDAAPRDVLTMTGLIPPERGNYRTLEYVQAECKSLAHQLEQANG